MRVVIVGCGRLGARLAAQLDEASNDVVIIDRDSLAFRKLASSYRGDTLIGTGIDEDVLRQAGIEQADCFIAATEEDNRNIFAAQVAKMTFNVPKVFARIYDPVRAETYGRFGLDVICPTATIATRVLDTLEKERPERAPETEG